MRMMLDLYSSPGLAHASRTILYPLVRRSHELTPENRGKCPPKPTTERWFEVLRTEVHDGAAQNLPAV
jgi:hypothetical protein